jgi:hypothetical protein
MAADVVFSVSCYQRWETGREPAPAPEEFDLGFFACPAIPNSNTAIAYCR